MFSFLSKERSLPYLIPVLTLAAFLRFYGINWDQNQHLHPDERFLTMVTQSIRWPSNIAEYFSTNTSPLNPHNQNFSFYVYGTFPIFLVKAVADITSLSDYNRVILVGRSISGFFDVLTILFIYLIGRKVFSKTVGLISAFLYGVLVLPIQLAHFYAVDTFLNFFLIITLYFLIRSIYSPKLFLFVLAGISFGLAFASKISAFLFISAILIVFLYLSYCYKIKTILWVGLFVMTTFLVFRITQPYAFNNYSLFDISINQKFSASLSELQSFSQPDSYFPPAVQWNNTTPVIYPLKESLLWGLGIPAGIICLLAIIFSLLKFFKIILEKKLVNLTNPSIISIMIFITITFSVFTYQGIQFNKPLRYFFPMLPSLVMLTGYFLIEMLKKLPPKSKSTFIFVLIISWSVWPFAFFSIYTRPHSRVSASEWIYQNIPQGSTLGTEHWDDGLPLNLNSSRNNGLYNFEELPMFDEDSNQKWQLLSEKFNNIDYLIITSNRVYGSVVRLPKRYSRTIKYYQDLFNGKLEFSKVAEFTSRPTIFGIEIIDDNADETFTVYDHPKVTIFKKKGI